MDINKISAPLISVGIPSYNRAHKIGETIDSILNQKCSNIEILISNNASTDDTKQVCEEYQKNDSRIKYYEQKTNIGAYANYDFLKEQAKGKYFMWICDDDQLNPNVLNKYIDFLENSPEYNLVSGQIQNWRNGKLKFVEKNLSVKKSNGLSRVLAYYSKVQEGAMIYGLIRKADLENIVMLKNKLGSDWHLVAHLAYKAKIKQLNFVAYEKQLDGFSGDWEKYAKTVGATRTAGKFPFFIMGIDAFYDIYNGSTIYHNEGKLKRLIFGSLACFVIWFNFYCKIYPRIIAGRIKRFILNSKETTGKPVM